MNAEGVGLVLSPEVIQATMTGALALLAALWVLVGLGALWRRSVWREAGATVLATAEALGGTVQSRWLGYRVLAEGVQVDWAGGLRGPHTRVRVGKTVQRRGGLLGLDDVLALVRA